MHKIEDKSTCDFWYSDNVKILREIKCIKSRTNPLEKFDIVVA